MSSCEDNSFVPGTKVLLADGRTVPIENVKIGDKVVATSEAGKSSAQTVVATIIGTGSKDLVRVTLRTGDDSTASTGVGKSAGQVSQIVATAGHPFWVPELGRWVDAGDLESGQWLHTSSGTWVQVEQVSAWTAQATVHNLTVDSISPVLAGSTPVFVHNCGASAYGSGKAYTTVYEHELSSGSYPGKSRQFHFRESNRALHDAIQEIRASRRP